MGFVDFILNLAGLLLWLNWLSVRLDPLAHPTPSTLAGTLRKAERTPARRWIFGVGLGSLLVGRALGYWQIGAGVNWTPKLDLGAITLSFPLSFRGDFFGLMLLYSLLSFLTTLCGFYLWLLLLSFLGGKSSASDPFFRLTQAHLGGVARWPWLARLALPVAGVALLWVIWSPLLAWLRLVPPPVSWMHRLEQALLLGLASFLAWKHLLVGLLALHLLNSYVYLGNHPFWNFVALAARNLLKPFNRVPLRVDKVDFVPLVAMAIVLGLSYLAQHGRNVPLTDLRIPSLADLYQKLPL